MALAIWLGLKAFGRVFGKGGVGSASWRLLAIHTRATSWVVVLVAMIGCLGAVVSAAYQEREIETRNRLGFESEAGKLALAFSSLVRKNLRAGERNLDALAGAARLNGYGSSSLAIPQVLGSEQLAFLGYWNADGRLLTGTPTAPAILPEAAQAAVAGAVVFGQPFRPSPTADYVLPMWRAVGDAGGGLWGYVGAGLLPSDMMTFFGNLATGKVGDVMLLDTRSRIVVVRGLAGGPQDWGGSLTSPEIWARLQGAESGFFGQVSAEDGRGRLYAYRPVEGTSLVVAVGTNPQEMGNSIKPVLDDIRLRACIEIAAFLAGALLMLGLLRSLHHLYLSLETNQQFLARISHELRTPLNAVIGFSDLMASESFGPLGHPSYTTYSRHIYDDGKNLLRLVDGVLGMSASQFPGQPLWMVTLDTKKTIGEALDALRRRPEAGEVTLELLCPPGHHLWADPEGLKLVLTPLLEGALSSAGPGGSLVIAVEDDPDAVRTVLTITASGPKALANGIAGFDMRRVHAIVEAHGGLLRLSSAPEFRASVDFATRYAFSAASNSPSLP